jgi:hypothetical protein
VCHQLSVPSQQCIGRDDRCDVAQGLPTEPVGAYGEPPPVRVGAPQSSPTDLPPEKAILFDQVGDHLAFPAIEPAGNGEEQQPKDADVDHGPDVISHGREKYPELVDPELGQYGRPYG